MSSPNTPSVLQVINDPNYVPLAANADGDILVTEDGTTIIVSSTLRMRPPRFISKRRWLIAPPYNARKG